MLRLPDLQREFFRAISGAHHDETGDLVPLLAPEIQGDDRLGAAERLGVYARMYCARLSDALAEDYPRVAATLGREAFATVAHEYVTVHPSTHPSVRWFGRRFAAFLSERKDPAFPPFLLDLARLEWARLAVFDASDAELLDLDALRQLPPESWASLRLMLAPAVKILHVGWPVHRIWEVAESSADSADWHAEDTWLRVWRQGDKVYQARMDVAERTALRHVQGGREFAAVCDAVATVVPTAEAAHTAGGLVLRWIEDGILRR